MIIAPKIRLIVKEGMQKCGINHISATGIIIA
jgi:hypothetical protein